MVFMEVVLASFRLAGWVGGSDPLYRSNPKCSHASRHTTARHSADGCDLASYGR